MTVESPLVMCESSNPGLEAGPPYDELGTRADCYAFASSRPGAVRSSRVSRGALMIGIGRQGSGVGSWDRFEYFRFRWGCSISDARVRLKRDLAY